MIRKSTLNINYSNANKLRQLDSLFEESKRVINLYIDLLWDKRNFSSKFVNFKVDSWLSARMLQCLGKQALEIVKSQRRKRKKTKPHFNRDVINLDSRFITILNHQNSFDIWFKFKSIGKKIQLLLPSKQHKHFNSFIDNNWELKKSCRLRRVDNNYMIDLYFEKQPEYKTTGKTVGIDTGYKKLAVVSTGEQIGTQLENKIEKISRKQQGSKSFKRALVERNNYINKEIKKLDLTGVSNVIVENLKNVKKNSKKLRKINTKFMNKLQRWVYSYFLNRLEMFCEISGVHVHKVNPAYTSQTCSVCGYKDKKSRKGEMFICTSCNYVCDADKNASVNILKTFLEQKFIVSV